jgi:hypothetical protein
VSAQWHYAAVFRKMLKKTPKRMKKNVDMHGKLGYNIITFEVNEKLPG